MIFGCHLGRSKQCKMANYTILYNPYAGGGHGEENSRKLESILSGNSMTFHDMTKIESYDDFFANVPREDRVVISGGDGTLNRFINDTENVRLPHTIYYFAGGSGNDFLRDVGGSRGDVPFSIDSYLHDLPEVTVFGHTYKFLNGVGYGIDGYCCEVGDRLREKSEKPVNYTSIAVKGLLFHYKPTDAVVTVDGKRHTYKKVWLAPTMNGRYYGGGMMPTPAQDRQNKEHTISTMVFYGSGRLKTLAAFPSIFKGEHIRHTDMVDILSGHDITVEFDRPTAIQIDGETILGVTGYHAISAAKIQSAPESRVS